MVERWSWTVQIGAKVKALRRSRGWSQQRLADRLAMSQARLSELERGDGSFTAEQLLMILEEFDVDPRDFQQSRLEDPDAALAAAVATLSRPVDAVPDINTIAYEVLSSGKRRLVVALATAVIVQIERVDFEYVYGEMKLDRRDARLLWFVDTLRIALERARLTERCDRARRALDGVLDKWGATQVWQHDYMEPMLHSPKAREHVWTQASSIARRWLVYTTITPEDVAETLRREL